MSWTMNQIVYAVLIYTCYFSILHDLPVSELRVTGINCMKVKFDEFYTTYKLLAVWSP